MIRQLNIERPSYMVPNQGTLKESLIAYNYYWNLIWKNY